MKRQYPDEIEGFRDCNPEVFSYIANSTAFEIFVEAERRLQRDAVFTGEVRYRWDQGACIFSGGDREKIPGHFHRRITSEFHLEWWTEEVRRRKRHPEGFGIEYVNTEIALTLPEWSRLVEMPIPVGFKTTATATKLVSLTEKVSYVIPGLYFMPFKKGDAFSWRIRIILGDPPCEEAEDALDEARHREMYAVWVALIQEFRKELPFEEEPLIGQFIAKETIPDTHRSRVWTLIDKALSMRF